MAIISFEDFRSRLLGDSVISLTNSLLDDDDPWLFRQHAGTYDALKQLVEAELGQVNLTTMVVGSAKFGYSVAPDTFGRSFRANSDVDVAIISAELFDSIWADLLRWRYPWHTRHLQPREKRWAVFHLENHFHGFLSPEKLAVESLGLRTIPSTVRPVSARWFNTFRLAGNIGPARGHDVEGRLYRSVDHLRHYLNWGLTTVKVQLTTDHEV